MKIIQPSFEIMDDLDGQAILKKIERCGRVCYKSEDRIADGTAEKFISGIIKRGHESVLEHVSFTVKFITDRGISHEIVRHRLASYSQESTRYVRLDGDMEFIAPLGMNDDETEIFEQSCSEAEVRYHQMLLHGSKPQVARDVLPNALKTEIVMSANLREWRHFLKMRTGAGAHPKIRQLAGMLLAELQMLIPVVFDDIPLVES